MHNFPHDVKSLQLYADFHSGRKISKRQTLFFFLRIVPKTLWKVFFNTVFYSVAYSTGTLEVLFFYLRQKFFGNKLPNFHTVDEEFLHRGGQPSNSGLKTLVKSGVKTIINLRTKDFNHKVIREYYQDNVRTFHIPFYPYEPEDRVVIEFLKIVCNPNHRPSFVHCFHGLDRTGMLVAVFRIVVHGWTKEEAINEMKVKGLHWYHNNMIEYIRNLDVKAIRKRIGLPQSLE